ncbi:MAG: hypothetical protein OSJ45_16360, partial [Lachnospiraceae bacterium]|nr:hypothetical protein [Lachnospiraceae bacterium]
MKFFRQTKETKRKLSFFLALAMVVSLLPVSPVAKATEQETAFKTSIEGAYVSDVKEYADNTITTGAAIVTLKVSDDAKKGKTIEQLGVTSTNELVSNVTTAVISVSHSAIGVNLDVQSEYNKKEVTVGDNGEFQVIVKNITESDKTITITGSWKTEGTNTPSTKPTNPNEPSKPSEPTPTPVTVTGTVSGSAAGIKEVSVDVPSGQGNVDNVTNNLGKANYYTKSDGTKYKETDVRDALKNSSNIKTSLVLSESEDEVQTKAVSDVKKNKNNIENLSSAVDQASFDKMVDEGVVLDIDLTSYIMQGNTTIASIKMSNLKNAVTVKMDIPESLKKYAKEDGHYYVIRIHEDGKITIIECKTLEGNKISFESDKFSTYIVTFKKGVSIVDKPATDPTPTPTGSGNGNNNGYIPGPGQSPAPSSSAAPSSTPSSAPSGTPGTNPTNAPGNPSGAPTDPT